MSYELKKMCDQAADLVIDLCQKVKDMEADIAAKESRIEELEDELKYANEEISNLLREMSND